MKMHKDARCGRSDDTRQRLKKKLEMSNHNHPFNQCYKNKLLKDKIEVKTRN